MKGIHDPWRLGKDDWTPPKNADPGTAGSTDTFDRDLLPETSFIIRFPGGGLKIIGATDADSAVTHLFDAYKSTPDVKTAFHVATFIYVPAKASDEARHGFVLKDPHTKAQLVCEGATSINDGLLRLHHALIVAVANNRNKRQAIYNAGIIPLLE